MNRAISVATRTRMRYAENSWQDDFHPRMEPGSIFRFDDVDHPARLELVSNDETAGAGLVLHDCAQQSWCLTVTVPQDVRDAFLPAVLTLLHRLAPDLLSAFLVSHAIGSPDQPNRETIQSAWDEIADPVIMLDGDLIVGAANVAADHLMNEARFFRPRFFSDHLSLASRDDASALETAVNRLLGSRRESARVTLAGLRNSGPLVITLNRAGSPEWRRKFVSELASSNTVLAVCRAPSKARADRGWIN
ncbi:hypothetical protein [Jiella mangrovi]|uniref:Uncharacterized protein n=1 Tax=Jiella mangrovi TaxID=2821407 RepID=A0ABS4BPC3_9HYPH|nr:hypothetical protein [Jiella mangrovi]MBP0618081.1 hypothetical protein [Jiella mangrovi]